MNDIQRFQMIHKQSQTGVMTPQLSAAISSYQRQFGLNVTGAIDGPTLAKYKEKWPYAWGLSSTPTGGVSTGADFSPMVDKIIGGVLLYGIFRVLMKVF